MIRKKNWEKQNWKICLNKNYVNKHKNGKLQKIIDIFELFICIFSVMLNEYING